ncbi:putative Isotrichodermin C-15 hydroxylase [Seiridium unicorne]|uniref:Isotrichodermin C-15 hydroxylase n=1 Tax=Seiridium unicorne TaxID=138068 RepID=A0ABR2V9I3_9PEZI
MADLSLQGGDATALLYSLITLATLFAGYQLFLHPLRRYPGPLLAKLTNGYTAYFAVKRTLHLETWKYHHNYGPVVRLGPDRLVFNSPQALKDIYRTERATKPPIYLATQAKAGTHSLWNSLDRDLHRRKRKVVGRATTDASMRDFEPTMLEQIDIFIEGLAQNLQKPVNMKDRCSYLSFDIIGLLSFGYALNLQSDGANQFLAEQLVRGNHRMNIFMQVPMIPRYKLQAYFNLLFKGEREKTAHLIGIMIRTRMAQDAYAKRDLYSFLAETLKAKDDDSLQMSDLWLEAFFFIIAGGDTTATAMSATLFYLSRNPESYRKLAQEIRTTFENADEIHGAQLVSCQYLRACVDEALRMSPPVPGTLWRHLAPEEEARVLSDPFTYNPGRWLQSGSSEDKAAPQKAMREAFSAFSVGARGCAGKPMAYLELSLVLAKTIWHFDFKSAAGELGEVGVGENGEFRLYDIFTSTHDGPYLVFEPRDTNRIEGN